MGLCFFFHLYDCHQKWKGKAANRRPPCTAREGGRVGVCASHAVARAASPTPRSRSRLRLGVSVHGPPQGGLLPRPPARTAGSPRETLRATHAVRVGPAGGRPCRAECASSAAGLGPHMAPPGISSGGGRALLLDPWLVTRITLGYKEGRCVKQPRNGRRRIWDSPRLGFICCLSELSPHVLCCGGSPGPCPPLLKWSGLAVRTGGRGGRRHYYQQLQGPALRFSI